MNKTCFVKIMIKTNHREAGFALALLGSPPGITKGNPLTHELTASFK
jgi:hypothetical protein